MSTGHLPNRASRIVVIDAITGGGGGGSTGPNGATGATGPIGATGPDITPGPVGTVLTSTGGSATYQFIQRTPIGPVAFIDPANSTGFASDANTGVNAANIPPGSGPILTTDHLNTLLFDRFLTGNRTITYMSDDVSGTGLDRSTLYIGPFTLTLQGTPQVLHAGGTLNAGTIAINPSTNQRQTVHTSDLATFNPYVFTLFGGAAANPVYIEDNVTTSSAWIVTDTTPATPSVTQPINNDGTIGALTIGNAYHLARGGILTLANGGPTGNGGVVYNDFAFTISSLGDPTASFNRCSFLNTASSQGSYQNCAFAFGAIGPAFITSGLYIPNGDTGETVGTLAIGGNAYIAQPTVDNIFALGASFIGSLFIFEQFGPNTGGIQIQDSFANGLEVFQGGAVIAETLIWGNGNTGVGVHVRPGASIALGSKTNGTSPTVTGTAGDFAFGAVDSLTNITVARAWNNAVGAYTEAGGVATRTTTWAHFTATLGVGGFNFQAHCLESGSALVGALG